MKATRSLAREPRSHGLFILFLLTSTLALSAPFTLDQVINEMLKHDPVILELEKAIKKSSLGFGVSLTYSPIRNDFGISVDLTDYITKQITGVDDVQILRARLDAEKVRVELEAVRLYLDWLLASEKVKDATEAVARARDLLEIAKKKFEAGILSPEALINTYAVLDNAVQNLRKAKAEELLLRYEILRRMGKVKECDALRSTELSNFLKEGGS